MNVIDKYKGWEVDLIKDDVQRHTLDYAVCMVNLNYDYNIGTLIRNANAFGAKEVFYVQDKKKIDPRGAVGTMNYTNVTHLKDENELIELRKKYCLVGVEQDNGGVPVGEFRWPHKPLIIFGSEGIGLSAKVLFYCNYCIEIPMIGSVRSLNVGTASGIVLHDYLAKMSHSPIQKQS